MCIRRRHGAECAQHIHLPWGVIQVIVAANHMGDAHVHIIDHHAEIVGRRSIRACHDKIVELAVLERDFAVHQVGDDHRTLQGILEAHDEFCANAHFGTVAAES